MSVKACHSQLRMLQKLPTFGPYAPWPTLSLWPPLPLVRLLQPHWLQTPHVGDHPGHWHCDSLCPQCSSSWFPSACSLTLFGLCSNVISSERPSETTLPCPQKTEHLSSSHVLFFFMALLTIWRNMYYYFLYLSTHNENVIKVGTLSSEWPE